MTTRFANAAIGNGPMLWTELQCTWGMCGQQVMWSRCWQVKPWGLLLLLQCSLGKELALQDHTSVCRVVCKFIWCWNRLVCMVARAVIVKEPVNVGSVVIVKLGMRVKRILGWTAPIWSISVLSCLFYSKSLWDRVNDLKHGQRLPSNWEDQRPGTARLPTEGHQGDHAWCQQTCVYPKHRKLIACWGTEVYVHSRLSMGLIEESGQLYYRVKGPK